MDFSKRSEPSALFCQNAFLGLNVKSYMLIFLIFTGVSLSLSCNGSVLAIGGPSDDYEIGGVWIFVLDGFSYVQVGQKLSFRGNNAWFAYGTGNKEVDFRHSRFESYLMKVQKSQKGTCVILKLKLANYFPASRCLIESLRPNSHFEDSFW